MNDTIAVIGAGPAGALFSKNLAEKGKKVLLFDHRAPWEKPCGGILGLDIDRSHIDKKDYPYPINYCSHSFIVSPQKKEIEKHIRTLPVVSRHDLSTYTLKKAEKAGVLFFKDRVISMKKINSTWHIATARNTKKAGILVGADGALSITRKTLMGEIPKKHMFLTCGYFMKNIPKDQVIVKLLDICGYLWVVSCSTHTSVGILAQYGTLSGRGLFKKLDRFLANRFPSAEKIKPYSALLPSAQDPSFFDQPVCGADWMLLGDAAGHVEPILGEGLYFAMESGRLGAEAVLSGDIKSYDQLWRRSYGDRLIRGARERKVLMQMAKCFGPKMYGALMYNDLVKNPD